MARSIEELEKTWNELMAKQTELEEESDKELDKATIELISETLKEHPKSRLASEIHYHRGSMGLMYGEGLGGERLAKARSEFKQGFQIARELGDEAEPWRSLNHTQVGVCLARMGNIKGAAEELKAVAAYRPRSVLGLGALVTLSEIHREEYPRDAKRFDTQRLSYARALIRENSDPEQENLLRYLLAQELLDSSYANEGKKLMEALKSMTQEELGEELFQLIHE